MKNVSIDGLELTDKMVKELTSWYDRCDSRPEEMLIELDETKNLLIKLMCNGSNDDYTEDIKASLTYVLNMENSLKNLVPEGGSK